jgi:hypothetical protein
MKILLYGVLAVLVGCTSPGVVTRSGGTVVHAEPDRAVVVVRIHAPWWAPRFVIRHKFANVLGDYERLGALEAKYFSISDAREYGGIYLWASRAAADDHFTPAWRADIRAQRGVDPDVQMFGVAFVVDGAVVPRGDDRGARSLAYPGSATWARWSGRTDPAFVAAALRREPELVRAFVMTDGDSISAIALWASRAAADRATSPDHLRTLAPGVPDAAVVRFETPLLIDATLRDAADTTRAERR